MTTLYAQPYDIFAAGFFFESTAEYKKKSENLMNSDNHLVEEFEIQFIDGDELDAELFKALGIHQGNIEAFFTLCNDWHDHQKVNAIIAVGECGYDFDIENDDPDDFDIDLYEVDSLKELAEQFIDEGLFGEIPENIRFYLDYDAIARDLGMDYTETRIAGQDIIYRCA